MKKTLLFALVALTTAPAMAQITIQAADMPVNGDTLRYSTSLTLTGLNLTNTGANITWDYSMLTPLAQQVDTYKTASQAGYGGGGIPTTAAGYKVADTLAFPGATGISATNVYTFFSVKTGPGRYVAEGFGAKLNGALPIPAAYSDEDEWYFFPLSFGRKDTSTFKLTVSVLGNSLKQQGTRWTNVDGWGTIKTPYYTTPVAAIRVRSEVDEVDSVSFSGTNFAIPRHYVDYKWLANGQHYPAMWITTNIVGTTETPTTVRYRDTRRALGVGAVNPVFEVLAVYPNPAIAGEVTVRVPASWNNYTLHLFDATGRAVSNVTNTSKLATDALPSGHYTIIAESNGNYGAAQFVK